MEQQDARYDTGISVLCWRAECHCILIKLRGEPAAAGVWQEFVLWPFRQTRLAHVEGGWKSKREEMSPILTGAPKTGRAELPHSQTKRKIPCDTRG